MNKKERLEKFLNESEEFIGKNLTRDDNKFEAWNNALIRFAEREYGEKSSVVKLFRERWYTLGISTFDTPHSEYVKAFENDLKTTIEDLKMLIDEADDYIEEPKKETKTYNTKNNPINFTINNTNTNNNTNYISIMSTEMIKEVIEDNSYIGDEEKQKLYEALDEIEQLKQSKEAKTKRWSKAKAILSFIIDKGADIAIMYLPHIIEAIK